jgi:hypothetical protein
VQTGPARNGERGRTRTREDRHPRRDGIGAGDADHAPRQDATRLPLGGRRDRAGASPVKAEPRSFAATALASPYALKLELQPAMIAIAACAHSLDAVYAELAECVAPKTLAAWENVRRRG